MWAAKGASAAREFDAAFEPDSVRRPADGASTLRLDLEALFAEHAEFTYRTAYGVTGRHEDAEDVLQTVFLRLMRGDCPSAAITNPQAYLYRAAVNVSLDAIRLRRRHVPVD